MEHIPRQIQPPFQHKVILIQVPVPRRHHEDQGQPRTFPGRFHLRKEGARNPPVQPVHHTIHPPEQVLILPVIESPIPLPERLQPTDSALDHKTGEPIFPGVIGNMLTHRRDAVHQPVLPFSDSVIPVLHEPPDRLMVTPFRPIGRHDFPPGLQHVVGLPDHLIHGPEKPVIDSRNHRKELHRTAAPHIALPEAGIGGPQEIKDQAVKLRGHIQKNSLVVLPLADLLRENFHREP